MWKTWLGKEAMGDSLVAQMVKNPPAIQETQAQSLDQEDPLEKGMATHSNIFTWRIPRTEESGRLLLIGSQRVGHDWSSLVHMYTYMGSGIPFLPWELFMLHNTHVCTLTHTHTHPYWSDATTRTLSAAIIRKTMTQCKLSMFCQCQWLSFLQNCSDST